MNSELYKLWQEIGALRERVQELEAYAEELDAANVALSKQVEILTSTRGSSRFPRS